MTQHSQDPSTDIPIEKLVAHISHDFNNLFSVIIGGLSLIKDEIPTEHWTADLQVTYEDILSASREATALVTQLNNWAGRQPLMPTRANLNELLLDFKAMLESTLGRADVQIILHPTPVFAFVDTRVLQQNLLHIISNAREAMAHGGTLEIRTLPGPCIEIRDQGEGMSSETLRQCTQPFFTTRKCEGHQGLGLAMVAGFCRASAGRLELHSEPGTGTQALLHLPIQEQ